MLFLQVLELLLHGELQQVVLLSLVTRWNVVPTQARHVEHMPHWLLLKLVSHTWTTPQQWELCMRTRSRHSPPPTLHPFCLYTLCSAQLLRPVWLQLPVTKLSTLFGLRQFQLRAHWDIALRSVPVHVPQAQLCGQFFAITEQC